MAGLLFESETAGAESEHSAWSGSELPDTVKHVAHLARQGFCSEWLLQERHPCGEDAVMNNGVVGVTRDVQHLHFGTQCEQTLSELTTAHLLEDHVGEQQVDLALMAFAHQQRFAAMPRLQHVISVFVQNLPHQGAHSVFILNEHDGLAAAAGRLHRLRRSELSRRIDSWQIYLECRADANFAVDPNVATALLDDAIHRGESQASALANFFGGEERFKDS